MPTPDPQPLPPSTIGVLVGRDLVGDALIKLPFVRALRGAYPNAVIHWITSQGPTAYGSMLRTATKGYIDIVDECPAWLSGTAPKPRFDLLLDTRGRWRTTLAARRIPHKVFVAPAMQYLFSDLRPNFFMPKPSHIVDRLLQLIELAAGSVPPVTGSLPVPEELIAKARLILPPGKVYVGLAPGAGNPVKIWPRYKFEKVAAAQASAGRVPVFILGPQELAAYDVLAADVPQAKFPLQDYDGWGTAQLTIEHTLALARCLNVAVANDSGVGQMLAAADCPLISLFGPTAPEKLAPRCTRGLVINAQDFGSAQMNAIRWEAVNDAVNEMLKQ